MRSKEERFQRFKETIGPKGQFERLTVKRIEGSARGDSQEK